MWGRAEGFHSARSKGCVPPPEIQGTFLRKCDSCSYLCCKILRLRSGWHYEYFGLDCSGFVSWSLLNGGFDVGDRGAGELASDGQLTDLGEFTRVTSSLIKSEKIKVGDLFNFSGHISILVGQDENNYYIAESLNNFGGVVIKTYSKKNVANTFKYVVLMDEVYQGDGNLTDMWY